MKALYPQMWFSPSWNQLRIVYPDGYVEVNMLGVIDEIGWSESIISRPNLEAALSQMSTEAEFVGYIK